MPYVSLCFILRWRVLPLNAWLLRRLHLWDTKCSNSSDKRQIGSAKDLRHRDLWDPPLGESCQRPATPVAHHAEFHTGYTRKEVKRNEKIWQRIPKQTSTLSCNITIQCSTVSTCFTNPIDTAGLRACLWTTKAHTSAATGVNLDASYPACWQYWKQVVNLHQQTSTASKNVHLMWRRCSELYGTSVSQKLACPTLLRELARFWTPHLLHH